MRCGRLPPGAHIAPVSWVLGAGAFSFGVGMAIAGSCISAQFYRLGEESAEHRVVPKRARREGGQHPEQAAGVTRFEEVAADAP